MLHHQVTSDRDIGIIEQSISDGSLLAQDKDTGEIGAKPETLEWLKDEYQPRTDDT